MNDNILLHEDKKIYNQLITEYPNKKVFGLSKLPYYNEICKQAKSKNMTSKEYLNSLGFTLDNKKNIIYSEDDLINNLCIILHNKEYISMNNIKKNHPEEYSLIRHYSKMHNIKRCDQYLQEKGFKKTGEKTNNLSENFDSYSLSRLVNEYDAKASDLATTLHCSRQYISDRGKDIDNISTVNMNGWVKSYTDDEIDSVLKIINNRQYSYKDNFITILIYSNKLNFEKKSIVYIKNNFIKCMFECDPRIEKALKDKYFDILDDKDFDLLNKLDNLWYEQGKQKNNKYKIIEVNSSLRNKISNISAKKDLTIYEFLQMFDYQLKDKRIKNTDEALIETIKKYVIKDNIVRIRVKDRDYHRLVSYAVKNHFDGIEGLVNHFGFEYQRGKDSSNVIEKHINTIRERYIIKNNLIYICSYDPFYNTLNALAIKRHMDLQTLLKEWGFERVKNKYDLPKDYVPYNYKNNLNKQLLSNWNKENLKLVLEQLSNFNNEVYIDTNSYFYYIIFLQANLQNMDINELINSLGYKRIFKKTEDTEHKLSSVENLLDENKANYISNKLEKLKNIEARYKQVTDNKLRIERNKKLVKNLKDLYQGKCQLCGGNEPQIPIIVKSNGDIYSEVHHITSFSNIQSSNDDFREIDSYKNTIVLCPYHHKLVHFKNKGFKKLILDNNEVYLVGEDGEKIKLNLNYHIGK